MSLREERLRKRGIPLPRSAAEDLPRHAEKAPAPKAASPTFREAAEAFQAEYGVITLGSVDKVDSQITR